MAYRGSKAFRQRSQAHEGDGAILFGLVAVDLNILQPTDVQWAVDSVTSGCARDIPSCLLDSGRLTLQEQREISRTVDQLLKECHEQSDSALERMGGETRISTVFGKNLFDPEITFASAPTAMMPQENNAGKEKIEVAAIQESPGRYLSLAHHGQGGMGRVLLVHDAYLGRNVALKELLPQRSSKTTPSAEPSASMTRRFLQEARITGQLEHPAIVPVHELGQRDDGTIYYTMKLVRGRTLGEAIAEADTLEKRLKLLSHFVDLCQAIAYAHSRGVIHRDIKPGNVMVGDFGETVVLDWGLAKSLRAHDNHAAELDRSFEAIRLGGEEEASKTAFGHIFGTPAYMSPEQASCRFDTVDERSDIYSLGVVLYEILTGQAPFKQDTARATIQRVIKENPAPIRQLEPGAPAELGAICERAMCKNPHARYDSARDLAEEIQRFEAGALEQTYEYRFTEHLHRFVRRNKAVLCAVAAALICLLGISVFSYGRVVQEKQVAIQERNRAEQNAAALSIEKDLADRRHYHTTIALAMSRIEKGQFGSVPALLDTAPQKHRGWEWGYLHSVCRFEDARIEAHPVSMNTMAVSADGQWLATVGQDENLCVWDSHSRKLQWRKNTGKEIYALAFHPDGQRLVTVGQELQFWDAETGELTQEAVPLTVKVVNLVFHPDGVLLYGCTAGGDLLAYDTVEGNLVQHITLPSVAAGLAVSSDGQFLGCGDDAGAVTLRDATSLQEIWSTSGHEHQIHAAAFDSASKQLVTTSYGWGKVWDVATGKNKLSLDLHKLAVVTVAFHPDGTRFITGCLDGTAKTVDIAEQKHMATLYTGSPIHKISYLDNGDTVATANRDGIIRFWNEANADPEKKDMDLAVNPFETGTNVTFSPDGHLVAGLGWEEGTIGVWKTDDFSLYKRLDLPRAGIRFLAFRPGTNTLAIPFYKDREIRCYRLEDMTVDHRIPIRGKLESGTFDASGRYLALSYEEETGIELFDLKTRQLCPLNHTPKAQHCVAFGHNGQYLAAANMTSGDVAVWKLPNPDPLCAFKAHEKGIHALAFHPERPILASGSVDTTIALWDVKQGEHRIKLLEGHTDIVSALDFSPDGQRLLSGGFDHSVRLWDWEAGQELLYLPNANYYALDVEFSPDGHMIAATDSDPPVRIRMADPWKLAQ